MKLNGNFTGKLFACLTALAFVSLATDLQAQTMKEGSAKVRQIRGSAKYSNGGDVWVPLKVGTALKPGSTVQTALESIVDLDLGVNGPVIRVAPNTTMSLDKLAYSGTGVDDVIETTVNVKNGTIIGNVKKLAKASKYEIKTPNGVAGIRGTDYVVSVKKLPDGTYEVTFTDITGTLVIAAIVNGVPETVVLNAGESWTPGSDVVPTSPQLLDFYRDQVAAARGAIDFRDKVFETIVLPRIEQHVSPTLGGPGSGQGGGNGNGNGNF